jgi:PPOX class probable F420-dependent enzyme
MVTEISAIMLDAIGQFAEAKYLNLETFRKTGVGVRTPVWFAQDPTTTSSLDVDVRRPLATFYVYTLPDSGKAKRIRNNPKVRVAPCNMRGNLRGAWVDARARFCEGVEAQQGQDLLRLKYGLAKIIGDFFSRLRGRTQIVLAIELD